MEHISKIKIVDDIKLRNQIVTLYKKANHETTVGWSIAIATRLLKVSEFNNDSTVNEGIKLVKMWSVGKANLQTVRQASFAIHKLARETENIVDKTILRCLGQAIASVHVKEHALIASDYAIKSIGLINDNDIKKISQSRKYQLYLLRSLI
ncbi:MAG: hypothetical protein GX769_02655 [Erysipelothrix sp.]|nr:hypothetical protein [Erysipelothrix sp.]